MLKSISRKSVIVIGFFAVITCVCVLYFLKPFSGFGRVDATTVSGTWHAQYTLYPENFIYFGLQAPHTDTFYVDCNEDLVISPDGTFNQSIKCSGTAVILEASGRWNVSNLKGDTVIKLSGMRFLFPGVDLQGLSSVDSDFKPSNPIYVAAPLNSGYFDHWFSLGMTVGEQYAYPVDGYVILFPRRRIFDGEKVLAHGNIADEPPVEYTR